MNTVGIISVSPITNTGLEGSHAEYPRASKVERMPPEGNELASGSCCTRALPVNSSTIPPLPSCSTNPSCFSAVPSVSGWNQWVQCVTPSSIAQRFIPSATLSAVARSSFVPLSITSHIFSNTSLERYFIIFERLKTYLAKNSLGRFSRFGTIIGFFLKASPTT